MEKAKEKFKKWLYRHSPSAQGGINSQITINASASDIVNKAMKTLVKEAILKYDLEIKENLSELHPALRNHGIQSTICNNLNKIRNGFISKVT